MSPREGYSPGEAAVQRRKRQPSTEIRTTVTQVVLNAYRPMCQTISCRAVVLKYSLASSVSLTGMKVTANQVTAAVGTTKSQNSKKICIRMLRISMNQNGYA